MLAWTLFKKYLFSRRAGTLIRKISWISVIGVIVGVMSLILVTSVMNGFNQSFRDRLLRVEPHLVIPLKKEVAGFGNEIAESLKQLFNETDSPKTLEVYEYEAQDVIIKTLDGTFGGAVAKGMDEVSLRQLITRVQAKGFGRSDVELAPVEVTSVELGPREVILGGELARSMGIFEGDEIILIPPESLLAPQGEIPRVEKVIVRSLINSRISEFDQKFILYRRDRGLLSLRDSASREVGLEVRLQNPENMDKAKAYLQTRGLKAQTWAERNASMFFALKMEKLSMTTFLSLSALITGFSIITLLILLLNQKRKDIGILMTMGMSQKQTRRTFAGVGLILSLVGIFVGASLGVGACWLIDRNPIEILPDIYYDATIPAKVDMMNLLWILVSATVIAVISAWLPVVTSTKLTPVEALRSQPKR